MLSGGKNISLQSKLHLDLTAALKYVIDFVLKYKLVHVLFWIWLGSELFHTRHIERGQSVEDTLPDVIVIVGMHIVSVYFSAYYLVPKYLDKRKYGPFLAFFFLTLITCSILYTLILEAYTFLTDGRFYSSYVMTTISHLIDTTFYTIVIVPVITYSGRYKIEEKNKILEREKIESELNFLRSQINPHFLFNALNSIHVLIDIDKQKASEALTKFSSLLRYNLYETKDRSVLIYTEIEYLKNYIEIEKLRIGRLVRVHLNISPVICHLKIAPFVFVPFIENAFKHVTRHKNKENFIDININVEKDSVYLQVENTYEHTLQDKRPGIGLENIKRRLELLYPGNYTLDITSNGTIYAVKLTIYASETELPGC